MTLANLLRIGQLKEHPADAGEIARLLAAAERGIVDARVRAISPETRFDAAYRSIAQTGLAALMAQGLAPATRVSGTDWWFLSLPASEPVRSAIGLVHVSRSETMTDEDDGLRTLLDSSEQVIDQEDGYWVRIDAWEVESR